MTLVGVLLAVLRRLRAVVGLAAVALIGALVLVVAAAALVLSGMWLLQAVIG